MNFYLLICIWAAGYFASCIFAGFCGYVCFSIVAGLDVLGKRIFISVVGFGFASMCGLIFGTILISATRIGWDWTRSEMIAGILVYVLSGFAGVWFALKGAKALLLAWKRR
jgi:uncharacterized membrane protein YjjP (DUF1212 family)